MKEIPMLMSAPMVRSLRAWQKTMTRREIKDPELIAFLNRMEEVSNTKHLPDVLKRIAVESPFKRPYGTTGDRLWIREAWQPWGYAYIDEPEFLIKYPADGGFMMDVLATGRDMKYAEMINQEICDRGITMDENGTIAGDTCPLRTRPSIHLWKEFSRIWLEVTELRIERLHDITEADAIAEGVELVPKEKFEEDPLYYGSHEPISAFKFLWWEINTTSQKKFEEFDSWEANPWVWVIGFKILSVTGKNDIGKGRKEFVSI